MSNKDLTDIEIDALKEVGNVGVGNAVTALSKLLNKKIGIDIPRTGFVPLKDFATEVGGPEKVIIGTYMQISGDLVGESIFLFDQESALNLADAMMGQPAGTSKEFKDMAESGFKEMTNIFSGAYLSSLANMMDINIFPGLPHTASDMLQPIVDMMLISIAQVADEVLCVKTKILVEDDYKIDGEFILVFEDESLRKLLKFLKEKYGVLD